MQKKVINTPNAPEPIGPYNQAILAGNLLFVSGQIALDPQTGELISGDIKSETRKVMENIQGVLNAANMNFQNVLKATIFISDMDNFSIINEIYAEYFDADAPARECIEAARLPKDVNVEISVVAMR